MKCYLWNSTTEALAEGDQSLLSEWRENPGSTLWLHISGAVSDEAEAFLEEEFNLHPLGLQDAKRDRHPPKFEHFGNTTLLIFKALSAGAVDINFKAEQLAIFLGDGFLVTRASGDIVCVDEFRAEIERDPSVFRAGSESAMVRLVRLLIEDYRDILFKLEPRLDALEEGVLDSSVGNEILAELTIHKSDLKRLRRVLLYHELLINQMRHEPELSFADELKHHLNDLYEQQERCNSLALLYYEMCSDLIEGYLSMSSHRLNEIMKVLTIVSAVFIPLGFLAGLYGMNFVYIPELGWRGAYFVLLGVMAIIVTCLMLFFRKKKWI
ncbi:magnesium transporter CorA family protein [Verrucomicrobiales bacterium BCK34]|nr:magnesium transporter CorA family protein [Verrucomicrobiales bacterium BCK34]